MRGLRLSGGASAIALATGILAASATPRARAAGVEDTPNGTIAMGRQANVARVNDFMAVWQNPANLAVLPRQDVGLDLRMPVFDACFTRARDPSKTYLSTESFDKSCSKTAGFTGNAGYVRPLPRRFGIGVGVYTPPGTPHLAFGNGSINTTSVGAGETAPTTSGVHESPGRYLLVDRTVNAAYLMVGAGWAPTDWIRMGLSLGSGFVNVSYKNVTSVFGGDFTDPEILSSVNVTDAFVPRVTTSVAATPLDSVDLVGTFTWNGDVKAKGNLDVTANGFNAPQGDCGSANPGPHCKVNHVTLNVPYQRFEVLLGGRYAMRNKPRERVIDPMVDEVFDVELNGYWSQTSHVDNYTLNIWQGTPGTGDPRQQAVALSTAPGSPLSPLPNQATLYHGWRDTYGLRLGGDYNVIQSLLAVRAGIGYESSAIPSKNMNLDYWPVQKVTISLGATVKINRWKISAGYAHAFNQTVNNPVGQGNVKEITAIDQSKAFAVNEGRYTSKLNVISLQGNVSF